MIQMRRSESDFTRAVSRQLLVTRTTSIPTPEERDESKFSESILASLSGDLLEARDNETAGAADNVQPASITGAPRRQQIESINEKMDKSESSKRGESQPWRKLIDDYERIQLVASSIARSKLMESSSSSSSSSSSEDSADSYSSRSQASTVCDTQDYKARQVSHRQTPATIVCHQDGGKDSREDDTAQQVQRAQQAPTPSVCPSSEVRECVHDLVEAVASSCPAPMASAESSIYNQQVGAYKTFKLHEVVLAKTRSNSSAQTSATEDSGSSSCDELFERPARKGAIQVECVGEFHVGQSKDSLHDGEQLKYITRQARSLAQVDLRVSTKQYNVGQLDLTANQKIRCIDANSNDLCAPIDSTLVTECLIDDNLVIWLLRNGHDNNRECRPSEVCASGELDLDDIALALNEPVSVKPSDGGDLCASKCLVWRCLDGHSDAKRLREIWTESLTLHRLQPDADLAADLHQIEVKPSEVSLKIEQMESSGLFVLQPEDVQDEIRPSQQSSCFPLMDSNQSDEGTNSTIKPKTSVACDNTGAQLYEQQSQTKIPTSSSGQGKSSNISNYYKSVASKVIISSSSKFKNFTLESGQTLARGAKRLSIAINQLPSSNQASHASARANEPEVVPKAKPRSSVLKREVGAGGCAAVSAIPRSRPTDLKSILKKDTSKVAVERVTQPSHELLEEKSSLTKTISETPQTGDIEADIAERKLQRATVSGLCKSAQDQLERLRSGSASSVSSKARQRRPALLLPSNEHFVADQQQVSTEQVGKKVAASKLEPNASASSPIDGTVRAKVSMSHLRRSVSMKMLATDATGSKRASGVERVPTSTSEGITTTTTTGGGGGELGKKKSEFDPRSLRKLSSDNVRALRQCNQEELVAFCQSNQEAAARRQTREQAARRRRSVANLAELKAQLDQEQARENETEIEANSGRVLNASARPAASNNTLHAAGGQTLGRGLNLLRQSFKQKNLSAILSFATSRQSLRVKAPSCSNKAVESYVEYYHDDDDDDEFEDNDRRASDEEEATNDRWLARGAAQKARRLPADSSNRPLADQQKLDAIKVAEAKLLAAKQLKQQAQRLREQQKRSDWQQQTSIVDSAASLFYKQQQQQQQLNYQAQQQQQQQQQQYAFANSYNQHLFDPMTLYQQQLQQQQQQQRHFQLAQQFQIQQQRQHHQQQQQQQQQLAYFSNQSAHFMAAAQHQMAALIQTPAVSASDHHHLYNMTGRMPVSAALGPMSVPLIGQSLPQNQPTLINHQQRPASGKYLSPAQIDANNDCLRQNQHFIPMSVNHHSSFNIVYTAAAAAAAAAAATSSPNHQQPPLQQLLAPHTLQGNQFGLQQQQQPQIPYLTAKPLAFLEAAASNHSILLQMHEQRPYAEMGPSVVESLGQQQQQQQQPPSALRSKHSSLGASVRKTMRSILRNGKASSSSSERRSIYGVPPPSSIKPMQDAPRKPLKSALKLSTATAPMMEAHHLNSEGSDGDASSSSDSTLTSGLASQARARKSPLQAGRKSQRASSSSSTCSPSSSDSSLDSRSAPPTLDDDVKSGTLTKSDLDRLRRDFISNSGDGSPATANHRQQAPASKITPLNGGNSRKNVTFSTKLTSIL